MPQLNESAVEIAAMQWFEATGFDTRHGADISPGAKNPLRADYADVVLERRLRPALRMINSHLPEDAIEQAVPPETSSSSPRLSCPMQKNGQRSVCVESQGIDDGITGSSSLLCVGHWMPRRGVSDDGIEDGESLTHAGGHHDLERFSSAMEAISEFLECGIASLCGEGGHVQRTPNTAASTPDATLATVSTTVMVDCIGISRG